MATDFDALFTSAETQMADSQDAPGPAGVTPDMFDKIEGSAPKTPNEGELQEESWIDDPIMASRMVLDGMTLGWGDEAGSYVAAAAAKLMGDEKPYMDIYRDIHGTVKMEEEQYRAANPIASTALNVAGGFASPANWVAPGSGLVRNTARAGVEGAAYGAGTAGEGERTSGATEGGAWGLALGLPLNIVGKAVGAASTRRVAQDIREVDPVTGKVIKDGKVVPMTLAADATESGPQGFLHSFYRDVVGQTWGGHGKITAQEDAIMAPVLRAREMTKDALDKTSRNAQEAVARGKKTIADAKKANVAVAQDVKASAEEVAKLTGRSAREVATDMKANAVLSATKNIDDATAVAEDSFRHQAFVEGLPTGATDDDIQDILTSPNANVRMQKVEALWSDIGFDMLDNRKFQVSPTKLAQETMNRLDADPLYALAGASKAEVGTMVGQMTDFLAQRSAKGWIDGADFAAIRSKLGTLAAQQSDAGGQSAVMQGVYREMQSVLNDSMEKQLTGKNLERFKQHRSDWKAQSILRDAVTSASRKAGREGAFTPDDWVASIAKNSPRDARRGKGPLRQQADSTAKLGVERNKAITEGAETVVRNAEKQKQVAIRKEQGEIAKARRKLVEETAALERNAKHSTAKLERVAGNKRKIAELEQRSQKLGQQYDSLKENTTGRNPSIFQRMFASGILGVGYGVSNMVSGGTLGRTLASPTVQATLAGQTGAQAALRQMGPAAQGLATGAAATSGGISQQ